MCVLDVAGIRAAGYEVLCCLMGSGQASCDVSRGGMWGCGGVQDMTRHDVVGYDTI